MDEQALLDAINTGIKNSMAEVAETVEAKVSEGLEEKVSGIPAAIIAAFEKPEAKAEEEAKLEDGALAGVINMEVFDIPLGKAILGGFVAVVGSELVDGFLAKQGDMVMGLVKLAGAGAVVKWGSGLLGKGGATAVALLLAYDGIRQILPIDQYARRLATGATGIVTTRGLGGNTSSAAGNGAGDYYTNRVRGL